MIKPPPQPAVSAEGHTPRPISGIAKPNDLSKKSLKENKEGDKGE
jgi:hypothetical protein